MFSNIKNIFKVPDLRNKILFTFGIVAVYRLGVAIRVPGIDCRRREAVRGGGEARRAHSASSNLFSGGAFGSFSIFALGIMPYITASIIMQVLGVVIPKLEQLQQAGRGRANARSPSTRATSRSAIALLQGTGLTFIFGQGRGSAFFGAAQSGAERAVAARRHVAAWLPRHRHPGRRHGR